MYSIIIATDILELVNYSHIVAETRQNYLLI